MEKLTDGQNKLAEGQEIPMDQQLILVEAAVNAFGTAKKVAERLRLSEGFVSRLRNGKQYLKGVTLSAFEMEITCSSV